MEKIIGTEEVCTYEDEQDIEEDESQDDLSIELRKSFGFES